MAGQIRSWLGVLLVLSWVPLLAAQNAPIVREIEVRHVGPPATSDELIKANIQVQEGDVYNRTSVDDDVRNLYKTGFFYNIRVVEEDLPDGVKLIYVVQGKPTLTEILFEGNEVYDRDELMEDLESEVGKTLEEFKLFRDAREIERKYEKDGYQRTTVEYEVSIDKEAGQGTATFVIDESPKVKIDLVDFVGNEAFDDDELRDEIETRDYWFFSWLTGSGVFKEVQFQQDQEQLKQFYRNHGYLDFDIEDIHFEYTKPTRLTLRFFVFEGQQYKVGGVGIEGNELFSEEEIRAGYREGEGMKMLVGEVFSPRGLRDDIQAIRDFYGAKGYIDARVNAEQIPNTEKGTMDLIYHIDEGNKTFIEKIEIQGNTKTKDKVIRRELAVTPGEVFDMVRVRLSKERLQQMNFFSKVDTQDEETDVPDRRNLLVSVEEKSTGNINLGAGFSSIDSLFAFVTLTQGNFDLMNPPYFTGGGQKLRLNTTLGLRRRDYQLSFIEPWLFNRKLEFGVDLYHRELLFLSNDYDQSQTGARFSLTKALWSDFLIGGVSYTIENIGINNVDDDASDIIKEEEGNRLVSKVGTSLAYDTRNSVQLPDAGQRTEIETELAGGPFGGDTDIYKLEFGSAHYYPGFFEGHVIELGARIGVVESYGDSDRVPLFDRFFLGGANTLRGFDFRDVGPKDDDEPIGGNTWWFGSVEYSVPVIERLRFAMFYDIGMVYQEAYSFEQKGNDTGAFNDNWGVGLRLNLPIGPLRLDYGIPIHTDDFNDSSGKFQFNVGYRRDF